MNNGLRDARFGDDRPTRSLLLSLLTEAGELEHGLACCYLFAAFSLKKELSEPGMTWQRQRLTRMWAAQIFMIAAQEMQHLAEVWNLLGAFGGTAYYGRPAFPQASRYYALHPGASPRLELTAFSRATLDRFILFEEPDPVAVDRQGPLGFATIGGLYRKVQAIIAALDEDTLFLGDPTQQAAAALVDFPGLIPVTDTASALAAVERIIDQGEGTRSDRVDSHLGVFRTIRDQLDAHHGEFAGFDPARPVTANPIVARHSAQAPGTSAITNTDTAAVAELFDSAYALMLQLVLAAFSPGLPAATRTSFARVGIGFMPTVIRPLAETLTQLRVAPTGTATAGPGFYLSRFLPLPAAAATARALVAERLDELGAACATVSAAATLAPRIHDWTARLEPQPRPAG